MSKKAIALFVICLLTAQLLIPGMAGAGIADQTNLLKQYFKIPAQAKLERETIEGSSSVSWTIGQEEDLAGGQAEFDEKTGELLFYTEQYEAPKLPVEMKQADVQKYVENIIAKMLPDKKPKVKIEGSPYKESFSDGTFYTFFYQRFEGQIPVLGNGFYFTVNAATGRVINFSKIWYDGSLPDKSGAITAQNAAGIIKDKAPLQLEWTKTATGLGDLRFDLRPVYQMADGYAVNARTGELTELDYADDELLPSSFNANNAPKSYTSVSPDTAISEQAAVQTAKTKAGVPANFKLDNSFAMWAWGEQGRQRVYVFMDDNTGDEIMVSVDMVTGQVVDLTEYSFEEEGTSYDYNAGKTIAEKYVKTLVTEEFSETKLLNMKDLYPGYEDTGYSEYKFIRYIYGIPYIDNDIYVQLNSKGLVASYWFTWERNLNIPQLTGILEESKIRDVLAQNAQLDMVYWIQTDYETEIQEAQLVYMPKGAMLSPYDAVTGEKAEAVGVPAGTADHWAEDNFSFLAEKGVINPGEAINPNKPISRADFIKMLVLATYLPPKEVSTATFSDVGLSSPYLGYVEQAYARGIIKGSGGKFQSEKPITRQEAAVILVKALGTEGRIDSDTEIEDTAFKDKKQIASWAVRDVKVAAQLGYVKGANGYFKPVSNITWAEAAALISRYIENPDERG